MCWWDVKPYSINLITPSDKEPTSDPNLTTLTLYQFHTPKAQIALELWHSFLKTSALNM